MTEDNRKRYILLTKADITLIMLGEYLVVNYILTKKCVLYVL